MLLGPVFPQVFGIKCPFIREWVMFKYIGHGTCHIEVRDSSTNNWIDVNGIDGFVPSFKSEGDARAMVTKIKKHHPNATIKLMISTPKGWSQTTFE